MTAAGLRVEPEGSRGRALAADLGGPLSGGLLVGIPLTGWLLAAGNWPYLWADVTSNWLASYRDSVPSGWVRAYRALFDLKPWGFAHLAALPLAMALLWGAAKRIAGSAEAAPDRGRITLELVSVCYLAWFYTAYFVQFPLEYHAVPPILLALSLVIGWAMRSAKGPRWVVVVAALVLWAGSTHPLLRPTRLALWPRCFTEGATASVRDALALKSGSNVAPLHRALEKVADYLRSQGVRDREVTCYSLSTLPLYTDLDILPSSRFVQLSTVLRIAKGDPDEILGSVLAGPQRFSVIDMRDPPVKLNPGNRPFRLQADVLEQFPYSEPIVFRSGRYLVHRVRRPGDPAFERSPGPLVVPPSIPTGGPGL